MCELEEGRFNLVVQTFSERTGFLGLVLPDPRAVSAGLHEEGSLRWWRHMVSVTWRKQGISGVAHKQQVPFYPAIVVTLAGHDAEAHFSTT